MMRWWDMSAPWPTTMYQGSWAPPLSKRLSASPTSMPTSSMAIVYGNRVRDETNRVTTPTSSARMAITIAVNSAPWCKSRLFYKPLAEPRLHPRLHHFQGKKCREMPSSPIVI